MSRAKTSSRWTSPSVPDLLPDQLETELGQQLGNAPASLALLLNLSERRVSERLPCPGKDLLGEAGHIDF